MLSLPRLTYVKPSKFTAMAIIENMWLRKSKKRLGGAVLYQAMEQTRMRELASSVANPRTASQMGQRVKWSNLVSFYRANANWMKYAYETKSANQSEYNKFMQLNVANSQVFFTKQQAAAGSAVVCPYIMTQGSLPSIEFTEESGSWPSNVYYPTGSPLTASTTVAEFSQKVIQQNPAIRNGDQLSFLRFTQMFNSDTGYPYVIVRKYELVLDISSTGFVGTYLPLDYVGTLQIGNPWQIGVIDSGLAGGFLMILSRTQNGKTYVSSQRIITSQMDAILAQYGSQEQLAAAVASYGENADAFLSSTSADTNNEAPTPLAIVGVESLDRILLPGSSVMCSTAFQAGEDVSVMFSDTFDNETPNTITLATSRTRITISSVTTAENVVTGAIAAGTTFLESERLVYVSVRTDKGLYVCQFAG